MFPRQTPLARWTPALRPAHLIPLVLGLSALCSWGRNYYVAPGGSDGAAGTFSAPFATVQHAVNSAQPGETIYLRDGTYRETVSFGAGAGGSGTPGAEIAIEGFADEQATISGFDLVVAEQDGVGTWSPASPNIWKISLPPGWARSAGSNLVRINGIVQQEARWPNVADAFNFDHREMALSEAGSVDLLSAGPEPPYAGDDFFTGTYTDHELPVLPDGTWAGAMIDLSPFRMGKNGTGVVTNSTATTLEFRYHRNELKDTGEQEPYFLWNNLAALDQPGEAFLDTEGVSGPANTLYIWSPEGDPAIHHEVEVCVRNEAIEVNNNGAHLRFANLSTIGGRINCKESTSFITIENVSARFAGYGLNLLQGVRPVIALDGTNSVLRNSYVGPSFGGGVQARNLDNVVENNVIRRCKEFGVATWGGHNITVRRNTVAENGSDNIGMFSTASQFNYNHCYLSGLRLADKAGMNTNGTDVDRLNTEVAYNWVHHNVARSYSPLNITGGRGIRVDSGGGGVHNILIHHNIIWDISGGNGLVLWSLPASSTAYGDSRIRAYNNTVVDGEIKFQGNGSIGGHDVRNNIARRLTLIGDGRESAIVTNNLLGDQGFSAPQWPGNLFASPNFVSGASTDFSLHPDSLALDAGATIPPLTDGFSGPAPDIGALEYSGPDARVWSAGAIILPEDVPKLTLTIEITPTGERHIVVRNIPEGRVLPDEFALQLGSVITNHLAYQYSITDHQATGIVKFLGPSPAVGDQPISVSLDAGATWIPMGVVNVPPPGVSINPSTLIISQPEGGTTAVLDINGLLSKQKLIPLDFVRTMPTDLATTPVPLVVDTRALIASGEMNANGSNVRFRTADRTIELDYWIESGLDSRSTLFWLRNKPGESINGEQIYLALEDPSSLPTSDKTILTSRYDILEDPSLCVWYSANALAGQVTQGQSVALLPDLGARGHHSTQFTNTLQPHWNESRLAGLPTISFDGNDSLFAGLVSPSNPSRISAVVVCRNEINLADNARLISLSSEGVEQTWTDAGSSEDVFILRSTRRRGGVLDNFNIGKKAQKNIKFFTGEIAEILLFDEELEPFGRWARLLDYTSRKYALDGEARGHLRHQDTVEPATLLIDGQEITDFTILPDGSLQFTTPPAPGGSALPALYDIEIVMGSETASLPNSLVYHLPNYDTWAAPLQSAGLDSPTLDIERDRIVNLVEYLSDLDPQRFDVRPFQAVRAIGSAGEDVLHLFFRRSTTATDALVLIEGTADYQNWVTYNPDDFGFVIHDPDPDGDGSAILYRAEVPVIPGNPGLFRLKVVLLAP